MVPESLHLGPHSISAPAASECVSGDGKKQYKHSEDVRPFPPPGRDASEQDAGEGGAYDDWEEKLSCPVESGGGCRGVY